MAESRSFFRVGGAYQPLVREAGLDADAVFDHPGIRVWRSIPERENCTLDVERPDGSRIRLHIKRHHRGGPAPAEAEAAGIQLLERHGIPTTPLVGWGALPDGRSFTITLDLAGFRDAEKLVRDGTTSLDALIEPTAHLAARLHSAHLHHRDLYLCHFFASPNAGSDASPDASPDARPNRPLELRLIDAARVRRLPRWPFRRRWVIKDLAQFWYSLSQAGASEKQQSRWLNAYENAGGEKNAQRAIERKSRWIARHDARLREKQPTRNVSIDDEQR